MKKFNIQTALLLLALSSCEGQNNVQKMSDLKSANPLLCNPETALCEIPAGNSSTPNPQKPVKILYFTDPICSSCWGIEPQLRRLKLEYGHEIDIEYRMGGLLPSWDVYNSGGISKPSDVAHHWDEVSLHYDMPIDGDVWLEDPLPSSYPPSIAFKAAQLQDEKKALLFLRRIREMVFLEKKNITRWEHLEKAATQVGLDAARLKTDFEGPAKTLFQEDLALARSLSVRGFPTLFFSDAAKLQRLVLYGARPYENFEQTLRAIHPDAKAKKFETTHEALFANYPTLTTREFEVLSGQTKPQAEKTLAKLFADQWLQKFSTKNGPLWKRG